MRLLYLQQSQRSEVYLLAVIVLTFRLAAYAQLSTTLTEDVERAIFNDDKKRLSASKMEQKFVKDEANKKEMALSEKVARQEQKIQELLRENKQLGAKCRAFERASDLCMSELKKSSESLIQIHQSAVELRMQGLDYKAQVDNRCDKIVESIESRLGFVPSTIQKQVVLIKQLKVVSRIVSQCT